jgi:hypothetical protein
MTYVLDQGGMPYVARDRALSYGQKLALAQARQAQVWTAECVVPTRAGFDCEGRCIDGEVYCGPHKRTVGRKVVDILGGLL